MIIFCNARLPAFGIPLQNQQSPMVITCSLFLVFFYLCFLFCFFSSNDILNTRSFNAADLPDFSLYPSGRELSLLQSFLGSCFKIIINSLPIVIVECTCRLVIFWPTGQSTAELFINKSLYISSLSLSWYITKIPSQGLWPCGSCFVG